jgi:hypothetical protein
MLIVGFRFAERLDQLIAIPETLAHAVDDTTENPTIPVDPILSAANGTHGDSASGGGEQKPLRNSYDLDYVVDTLLEKHVFLLVPSTVASHPPLAQVHLHNNRGAEQRMASTMLLSTFAEMKEISDGAAVAFDQLANFQRNYVRQKNRVFPTGTLTSGALDLAGMLEDVEKETAEGAKELIAQLDFTDENRKRGGNLLGVVGGDSLASGRQAIVEAAPRADLQIPLDDQQPT